MQILSAPSDVLYFFNSFFIENAMREQSYQLLPRWFSRMGKQIHQLNGVVLPANINGNHWIFIAFDFINNKKILLDSLLSSNPSLSHQHLLPAAERALTLCYVAEKHDVPCFSSYEVIDTSLMQEPGDCGCFVCVRALMFLLGLNPAECSPLLSFPFRVHLASRLMRLTCHQPCDTVSCRTCRVHCADIFHLRGKPASSTSSDGSSSSPPPSSSFSPSSFSSSPSSSSSSPSSSFSSASSSSSSLHPSFSTLILSSSSPSSASASCSSVSGSVVSFSSSFSSSTIASSASTFSCPSSTNLLGTGILIRPVDCAASVSSAPCAPLLSSSPTHWVVFFPDCGQSVLIPTKNLSSLSVPFSSGSCYSPSSFASAFSSSLPDSFKDSARNSASACSSSSYSSSSFCSSSSSLAAKAPPAVPFCFSSSSPLASSVFRPSILSQASFSQFLRSATSSSTTKRGRCQSCWESNPQASCPRCHQRLCFDCVCNHFLSCNPMP